MSDMKCPFCQQKLRNCCAGVIYTCSKPDSCPHEQCYGSKELWQELIRTRKVLEVTKSVLENISSSYKSLRLANSVARINWDIVAEDFAKRSDEAREQVTALMQGGQQ